MEKKQLNNKKFNDMFNIRFMHFEYEKVGGIERPKIGITFNYKTKKKPEEIFLLKGLTRTTAGQKTDIKWYDRVGWWLPVGFSETGIGTIKFTYAKKEYKAKFELVGEGPKIFWK